jgi:branched-chain amino acid transport system permease protein
VPIAQILVNALMLTMFYALVASGLTLVLGVARIVNFAHGALYMLGAYVAYYVFEQAGLQFWAALLLAFLCIGLLGIILDRFLFRPLTGQFFATVIVCLGLILLIESGMATFIGADDRGIHHVFQGTVDILGARLSADRILVIVIGLLVMGGLFYFITRTKAGTAMRAVSQDSEAATLQGINLNYINALALGIGCALAGFAGALLAPVGGVVNPYMGEAILFKAILVITLGGFGSVPGAFIGALIIGFVESFGYWYIGEWVTAVLFGLVLVLLIIRPRGILGVEHIIGHH